MVRRKLADKPPLVESAVCMITGQLSPPLACIASHAIITFY